MTTDEFFEPRVWHRLALGVEPIDAVTRHPIGAAVQVGREVADRRSAHRRPADPIDPLRRRSDLPLETSGTTRFKLRHGRTVGDTALIRVDDPCRCYVPRRFSMPLWTVADVDIGHIGAWYRLLRPWLSPGPAYPVPGGSTGLRGRVMRAGVAIRWPRIVAVNNAGLVLGRAHGDERGEFLLLLNTVGTAPAPPGPTIDLELIVRASNRPRDTSAPMPADRIADLPLELVVRSPAPPGQPDLDNPLLRGEVTPRGYTTSTTRAPMTIRVGRMELTTAPIEFTP
ncbi:hypothetical protein EV644_12437 [Kribbella orskensis]|uniref:Uncharacterized protein n=1 Tax=Kribbella orskensis TaxID=2512216 RepID=A0ABY2B9Q5_9ACTN|nr:MULTISPECIES: hypothetical protein [Kribbella]TCN32769.1 hypothetical protein EV642_12661 [Kribbella sp. VKM Ac-2500]TCO12913.1 hypothetical protein EV644_12437 [Kribbella orskensis]